MSGDRGSGVMVFSTLPKCETLAKVRAALAIFLAKYSDGRETLVKCSDKSAN